VGVRPGNHRRVIRQQTVVINSIRAYLAEFGIVAPVGRRGVEQLLEVVADKAEPKRSFEGSFPLSICDRFQDCISQQSASQQNLVDVRWRRRCKQLREWRRRATSSDGAPQRCARMF
jgi:hypothetical protein